ncbi:MAG: histone deacetylase family protein [Sphingomonadaceae bacterium]
MSHAPLRELNNGEWTDYAETPARLTTILDALGAVEEAGDFGLEPILAVHDPSYVAFIKSAHDEWLAAGRRGDAIGYTFPVVGRRPLSLQRIDARIGAYAMDAATPIAAGTWMAAYGAAQAALSAFDAVARGYEGSAFAACRPPGHHAGADYMGGYCYLNNAAIVARQAILRGLGPVAVLDVDYHHGNGTQDIFYEDGDVLFASIHADPATDFPFYWGHADERGRGVGEGATINIPLPRGTGWDSYRPALELLCERIVGWGAKFLVVSFGADTFAEDPISQFRLETPDYSAMGAIIAGLDLPAVIVMEGGYAVDALGRNVAGFLTGFSGET